MQIGGTLILSGTENYEGGTYVKAGTLIVASALGLPDGSGLTAGSVAVMMFDPSQAASVGTSTVPEPSTIVLLIYGLIAGALFFRSFSKV